MGKVYWIWYPADFELYHAMKQNFSRVERGMGWPAFWKSEGFRNRVAFRRTYRLEKETSFAVYASPGTVGFVYPRACSRSLSRNRDDTYLFDFALLFSSVLLDFYEETKDEKTLQDLYPAAVRQIEIGLSYLTDDNIIPDHSSEFWCFADWGEGLNTQAASLAILIYSLRYGIRLARHMGDSECGEAVCRWKKTEKKCGGALLGRRTKAFCQWQRQTGILGDSDLDDPCESIPQGKEQGAHPSYN